MGFDLWKVNLEILPRPTGKAYDFMAALATDAICVGEGNAFGWYDREEMEQEARDFAATMTELKEILDWIATLPWDDTGNLNLHFNW